jgi:hypothetical protein
MFSDVGRRPPVEWDAAIDRLRDAADYGPYLDAVREIFRLRMEEE